MPAHRLAATLWTASLWLLAISFAAFSAVMNWYCAQATWTGNGTSLADFMPAGFVLLDLLKFAASGILGRAFSNRRGWIVGGCVFVIPLCAALSIAASYQLGLEAQAQANGHVDTAKGKLVDLKDTKRDLEEQVKVLGSPVTAEVVRHDIGVLEQHRRWTSTAGCTDVTASASQAFCAEYKALFSKLAAANKAEQLRARIDTLRTKISNATTVETQTERQVGLQVVADAVDIDKQVVATILMMTIAFALEIGGVLAWAFAAAGGGLSRVKSKLSDARSNGPSEAPPKRQRKAPAKAAKRVSVARSENVKRGASVSARTDGVTVGVALPSNVTPLKPGKTGPTDGVTDAPFAPPNSPSVAPAIQPSVEVETDDPVASFVATQLTSVAGARLPASQMQKAFVDWCHKHQMEPVSCTQFAKDLKRLGIRKTRGGANGSRVYHDVALRTH